MDTIKTYWHTWLWRDAVTKIITVNFIVWLVISCVSLFAPAGFTMSFLGFFVLPGSFSALAYRVWTMFTYMFTQIDFLHLLCNMLWLLLFGNLFLQTQNGRRLTILYIYGGLASAMVFLAVNTSHIGMYGASSAVMAIVLAATLILPQWRVNLMIFGPVKVMWLALAAVIFFVVLSTSFEQAIAHGVGALVGAAYALLKRRGIDITKPVVDVIDMLLSRRRLNARPVINRTQSINDREERELDALLAKVSRSGYASLSANERQRLFNLSQRNRH